MVCISYLIGENVRDEFQNRPTGSLDSVWPCIIQFKDAHHFQHSLLQQQKHLSIVIVGVFISIIRPHQRLSVVL